MAVALHVKLNTPAQDLDPATALLDLRTVLALLRDMDASLERADEFNATAWRFRSLQVGSLVSVFEPAETDVDITRRAQAAGLRLVRGFRNAESDAVIPDAWSTTSALRAGRIAGHLGEDTFRGLKLRLVVDDVPTAEADVTAAAGRNLRSATKASHHSIGSVVGTIGSLSIRKSARAGIWPERGGGRVTVSFDRNRLEELTGALGKRVQLSGRLERNNRGQLVRVQMRRVEHLPDTLSPDVPSNVAGIDPTITGGLDAVDYVRRIRGTS